MFTRLLFTNTSNTATKLRDMISIRSPHHPGIFPGRYLTPGDSFPLQSEEVKPRALVPGPFSSLFRSLDHHLREPFDIGDATRWNVRQRPWMSGGVGADRRRAAGVDSRVYEPREQYEPCGVYPEMKTVFDPTVFPRTPLCEVCGENPAMSFSCLNIREGKWVFSCDCTVGKEEYYIPLGTFFESPAATVNWLAHLAEKSWIDWSSFMQMMKRFRAATNSYNR